MKPIDWRDVYASNRAAIERAGSAPGALLGAIGGPSSLTPQPARRPPPQVKNGRPTDTRAPNGERTFTVAGRERRALVHVPLGTQPGAGVPLICMLHGCTQDAASFATATQMNAAADRHGFAIVYPQQERRDNQNRCWNWFLPQHQARGAGEPASIAAIVRQLIEAGTAFEVDRARASVAGLSAGGAMAAVMAAAYPDLFAAL